MKRSAPAKRAATVAQVFAARRAQRLVRGRVRRVRRKPRRLAQPDTLRLSYFRLLLRVLARARQLVEQRIVPAVRAQVERLAAARAQLDAADDLASIFEEIAGDMVDVFGSETLGTDVKALGQRTAAFHQREFAAQVKGALGIDIIKAEPWLEPLVDAFTQENVALVRSVPTEYLSDLEKRITRSMREGLRWEELADEIEERYGIAESRAKLIARDQVGKWMGELNSVRQQELGVTEFIWRTAQDNRVRESHAQLDGKTFAWDQPPEVDGEEAIPGEPINCRCQAEPVLDDLVAASVGAEEATAP